MDHTEGYKGDALCLTIVTRDGTFLLDTNEEAYDHGLDNFMSTIEPYFSTNNLQTIRIAVVTEKSVPKDISNYGKIPCYNGNDVGGRNETSQIHRPQIAKLMKKLQRKVDEKGEETFKQNRSQIQFDSKLVPRIDIRIVLVDSRNGFHQLLQAVSKDTITSFPQGWSRTLHLALPETADFDSCIVAMQASYKIMPFRLDSMLAMKLYYDLELISHSELNVLQLIPTESIDASLLYGVPIFLRSSLAKTTDQHRENLLILQAMIKTLAKKDCALLLSSAFLATDQADATSNNLFQKRENQLFLLMPEVLGSKVGPPTCNGVLFRIARADHMLDEETVDGANQGIHSFDMREGETSEYDECVEMSLESLPCSPLNPLYINESETSTRLHSFSSLENKKVTWEEDQKQTNHEAKELLKIVRTRTVSSPRSKNSTADKIWNDNSGIGLIMNEQMEHGETSPDKKARIEQKLNDEGVSMFDSCSVSDTNSSFKDQQIHPALSNNHDQCGEKEKSDHGESETADTREQDGGNDIEGIDDETSSPDSAKKYKRKSTEIGVGDSLEQARSKDIGETEWTQEEEISSDESCASSSSSHTIDECIDVRSPIAKFEYS
jgi:hypothetical protein